MKLDQLRQIIREEVRSAIKDELQEVLTEAVKIASAPSVKESNSYRPVEKNQPKRWSVGKSATLDDMLKDTAASMTNEDYRQVVNATSDMVSKPNFAASMASQMGMTEPSGPMPGIDISKLSFVNKAKQVLDKSYEKDRNRGL